MLSNLPPGVTGNEYAIGGAEREWDEERECPHCGVTQVLHHEAHREFTTGIEAWCYDDDCEGRFGFDVEPDEPDYETDDEPE